MTGVQTCALPISEDVSSSESPVIEYLYMNPGCGDNARRQTVREWFNSFGIPLNDNFFIEWATFQTNFIALIRDAERFLGEAAMRQVWSPIFGILYLCYDLEKEFLPQFRENAEKTAARITDDSRHKNNIGTLQVIPTKTAILEFKGKK